MKTIIVYLLASCSLVAQNLAVLTHGASNSEEFQRGCPSNWPAQVHSIGTATNLPPRYPPPWRLVTQAQVDRWKADHAAEMEVYQAAQEAAATQPKRDRETAIAQAVADLILIRDSTGPLTAAQLSNAVRAISKALVALIEEIRP